MSFNFQDPATSVMEGIIDFHHDIQFYLIIIVTFVVWMLFSIMYQFGFSYYIVRQRFWGKDLGEVLHSRKIHLLTKNVNHGTLLEIIWTTIPAFVLVAIAMPSFALLYAMDEIVEPTLTIKVIGHQWYWTYEYSDYERADVILDSYMVVEEELALGEPRLLEVDQKLWLPTLTHIRVLLTSVDVIHSWAIPSLGVKMDAIPGRMNQLSLFIKREGTFYGQCSELCGVNHGFMPIGIKAVPVDYFNFWINFYLDEIF